MQKCRKLISCLPIKGINPVNINNGCWWSQNPAQIDCVITKNVRFFDVKILILINNQPLEHRRRHTNAFIFGTSFYFQFILQKSPLTWHIITKITLLTQPLFVKASKHKAALNQNAHFKISKALLPKSYQLFTLSDSQNAVKILGAIAEMGRPKGCSIVWVLRLQREFICLSGSLVCSNSM